MPERSRPVFDHTGHRRRMLEEFRAKGLEGFSDPEVLEFLLSYSIARQDVNPLARTLLQRFGSLHQVFEASEAQLLEVEGIGPRTAALLRCCSELWGRCEQSRTAGTRYLRSTGEIGRFLTARTDGLREERAWLLSLDAGCKLLSFRGLCTGAVNAVNLPFRKVVEAALLTNASSVVLCHNHVNGALLPSVEDVEYTRDLYRALKLVDVILTDHIIVGDRRYLSMRSSGMFESF